MARIFRLTALVPALALSGCAGLAFNDAPRSGALIYYDSSPYLLVTFTKDCVSAASVISLPGTARSVSFQSGYGTADLSVTLTNGMIASVGQKTDTKVPETLTAIAGLATAAGKLGSAAAPGAGKTVECVPVARLYPIINGAPDTAHPITVHGELAGQ